MNDVTGFIRPQKKQMQGNPIKDMPKLFDAALTEFSVKSFDSASLNDIIKTSGISKGSFYHKFADKMDLYLCMIDRMSQKKAEFFAQRYQSIEFPEDFFEQIRFIVRHGIEYALKEPRYYALWRMHLAERIEVRKAVKGAFSTRSKDEFELFIRKAYENKQFKSGYSINYIINILELLIFNIDTLIKQDMQQDDIIQLIDNLVEMLKNGLNSRKTYQD